MNDNPQTVWDSKKIQILKVSQQIFARYGYFKTTMEDIARAMGMKKGSLYYYYKGKEDILKDVVHYESDQFLSALQQELNALKTPQEKVHRFLQFRLKEFMKRLNLHQISIQAFLEAASIIHEVYHQCYNREVDLLATVIQEGIDQRIFKPYDARRVANSLLTYAEAVKFREFHRNKNIFVSELDYSAIEEEILFTTDLIINGITAAPKNRDNEQRF